MARPQEIIVRLDPRTVRQIREQINQSTEKLVGDYLKAIPGGQQNQAEQVLAGYVAWVKKQVGEN